MRHDESTAQSNHRLLYYYLHPHVIIATNRVLMRVYHTTPKKPFWSAKYILKHPQLNTVRYRKSTHIFDLDHSHYPK